MKEVTFLSKMVYKGLGFGRASRRKLNTLLSSLFPAPSRKKTERLQPFYIL